MLQSKKEKKIIEIGVNHLSFHPSEMPATTLNL